MTLAELVDALEKDFEGWETLRAYLLNQVVKYGNDDDEADLAVARVVHAGNEAVMRYKNIFGGQADAGIIPVTSGIAFGKAVGALPSGRKSGEPYADSASPMPGMDTHGRRRCSVSGKMDAPRLRNGTLLNIKINPSSVSSDEGPAGNCRPHQGAFDAGVWHRRSTVSPPKPFGRPKKPKEYRNLLVRWLDTAPFSLPPQGSPGRHHQEDGIL